MFFKNFLNILLFISVSLLVLPSPAFAAKNKGDYFGYYIPKDDFRVGKFRLTDIAIAPAYEVKSYKSCTLRDKSLRKTFAPVMLEFSDLTSEKKVNTIGQEYYVNSPRILPETCSISGNTILFSGTDKQLGPVTFFGTINLNALKNESSATALKGNLTINGKTYKNIEFKWLAGD